MCDPHSLAAVDLDSGSRARTRDDNVGPFPSNCRGLAENAISDRLANTYLCIRARTRQSRISHALACGRSVLEVMPFSDWSRAGDLDRLCVLAGCHGDLPPDVTKSVSSSNDSVLSGTQLDIASGEGPEGADARDDDLGGVIG